jgi:hypothetical protein
MPPYGSTWTHQQPMVLSGVSGLCHASCCLVSGLHVVSLCPCCCLQTVLHKDCTLDSPKHVGPKTLRAVLVCLVPKDSTNHLRCVCGTAQPSVRLAYCWTSDDMEHATLPCHKLLDKR